MGGHQVDDRSGGDNPKPWLLNVTSIIDADGNNVELPACWRSCSSGPGSKLALAALCETPVALGLLTDSQVTGTRKTNPAVDLHELPRIDLICLSHYHA